MTPAVFGFGKNKISYDQFDWKIYPTTHFELHYYTTEQASLRRVASFAESAYERLSLKLNFQIDKKIPLIFYSTHSDFEQTNVDVSFIPEGVGAFAEPARNRMVLPVDLPDARLQELIAHELTHIFEYEILFQGELRKAILSSPPLWFMEGLASYLAQDEDDRARMVLRDAVVSDLIPRITESGVGGYFAYRYGHAAFDYIESEYGVDGVRDFIFEFRSALGNSVEKALKRAFEVTPEDFDIRFRRWLQKKYVPELVKHGEPIDFGERLRFDTNYRGETLSAVASPSGDLAAAFALVDDRVEIVVFGLKNRKLFRNLTNGRNYDTEYPIVQFLTTGPLTSRDLAWSPDGNELAYFARREKGRVLVLLNALNGDLRKTFDIHPDQPGAPTYSPDGSSVVFRGMDKGKSDIFRIDLKTGEQTNITEDEAFDASPAISPDGQWLYYSSIDVDRMKIFRLSLSDRSRRERITDGPGNDEDVSFSPDGKKIFFSSSRAEGIYNAYSLDLSSGEILQWTDAVSGCFTPTMIPSDDGFPRLLFTGYFRRGFEGYVGKMKDPIRVVVAGTEGAAVARPSSAAPPAPYTPEVEVPIDPANAKDYKRGRLFIENAQIYTGITDDQRFFSQAILTWSDLLGNKRAVAIFDSLSSYTDYRLIYFDLEKRLQKGVTAFSTETFFVSLNPATGGQTTTRTRIIREAGVYGLSAYPIDKFHRFELNLGYLWRSLDVPLAFSNSNGNQEIDFQARKDNFPELQLNFVGDSTEFREFGPYGGRRYELSGNWGAKFSGGGTVRRTASFDYREYFPVTTRSLVAFRFFGAVSDGSAPDVFYFGGLDTLRGYNFREQIGTRIAYTNFEFRFPLVDRIELPFLQIHDIRGRVFLDIGAAYIEGADFQFWDSDKSHLRECSTTDPACQGGLSAYGWGFSWDLGGIELHWDFAQRWNLRNSIGGRRTTFWIGNRF